MVRTKADSSGRKVIGAKAPRKQLANPSSTPASKDRYGAGNPVRWTPTPSWQKGIASFFSKCSTPEGENSKIPKVKTRDSNRMQ
ncbi:PCNA-associated factor-like [Xenia sp. Carnegie-2017]|uniref:PCNA-associated factor-like n=1 Tax=Xenia sp. Carnegie-2017 TaxID=2897299 RepID=UPI001F0384C3|nr:PCNA-associated factor-like [Xenia sp. Carnegie-2017]